MGDTIRARRGDLAIVHTHHRELGGYDRFRVGVVTNITRDYRAKKVKLGSETPMPLDRFGDVRAIHLISQTEIDVEAALATAAANPWPHSPEHKGKPYDTLDEVRAALRPHLKTTSTDAAQRGHRTARTSDPGRTKGTA